MSDFAITIRGESGVILDAVIDEPMRVVLSLALDDARLKELLVLMSVCAGFVEAECVKAHHAVNAGGGA